MTKYLEQTDWLLNPQPDRRKKGRVSMQCWDVGTRWELDEDRGVLSGEGMMVKRGVLADKIIANCKEVEPGIGVFLNEWNCRRS